MYCHQLVKLSMIVQARTAMAYFGRIATLNYRRLVSQSNLINSENINLGQYLIKMKSMTVIINFVMQM